MVKTFFATLTLMAMLYGLPPTARAGAVQDLRIDREKDSKRNTIYKLVNAGEQPIVARIELRKDCPGVTNSQPPKHRSYVVGPSSAVRLRKVWSESSCELDFRILEAAYYRKSG